MRATGLVALVLLTGTMVLGHPHRRADAATRSWPAFASADLHKRVSLLAMVFLAIHVS
jgi:sulfoxide reductase heme-binding subunit YedZ